MGSTRGIRAQQPEVVKKDNLQSLPVSPNPTTAPLASSQAQQGGAKGSSRPVAVVTPKQPLVVSKREQPASSKAPAAVKQSLTRRRGK